MVEPKEIGQPIFPWKPSWYLLFFSFYCWFPKRRRSLSSKSRLGEVPIEFVVPKLLNSVEPKTPKVNASMVLINPCSPWALSIIGWFDDEIKLCKLDDLELYEDLEKDATFGKLEDANPNLNSYYTICKSKKT